VDRVVVQGLHKSFGKAPKQTHALTEVSFRVPAGSVIGLIGPDGAGKTTLMRLMAGLLMPDKGQIQVLGMDVRSNPQAVQSSIGYMPQHFGLYEDLSVQENLTLYADLQGVPHAERAARFQRLLHMTGMAPFTERLAGRLSGGMKQKLGLACTLVRPQNCYCSTNPPSGLTRSLGASCGRLCINWCRMRA